MMRAILLTTISILFLLTSCVPQQSLTGRKIASDSSTSTGDGTTDGTTTSNPLADYYWYSGGTNYNGAIDIDQTTNDSIFIRGTGISDWLSLPVITGSATTFFEQNLCLVATYVADGAQKQSRFRAVAITYPNLNGELEKLIRVDISSTDANSGLCSGTLSLTLTNPDTNNTEIYSATTAESAFDVSTICPTCQVPISSLHLGLVYFPLDQTLSTYPIPSEQDLFYQPLDKISMTIKAATAVDDGSSASCSNSACQALNKDCCLDGQCVINGAVRPNATLLSEYTQAMLDYNNNPATYINYPQVFYVCQDSTYPIPTPDPTPTPDPGTVVDEILQALIKKYNCLEGAKLSTPDYSACEPDGDQTSYIAVRNAVWQECGCQADFTLTDETDPLHPVNACPDFGLQATATDALGTPTAIECLVPQPDPEPTPFQQLDVQVPSRSVPHRFFSSTGTLIDDLTKADVGTTQEVPTSDTTANPDGKYSMNRILGDMTIDLSKAQPAKMINVQYAQSYVIRAKAGSYYTPCPACSKDSWYEGYTAFAEPFPVRGELFGNGLQAGPTSTNRRTSSVSTISKGNYEDTIWGRACWLPPTMIPFSQNANSDVNIQRRSRLETQAALYMNGYRKDWFGFNQGALIGSFDGVKWFAIGSGRQVTATSSKLYLAINAPFADLAAISSFSVEIVEYLGPNSVAIYDFDPSLSLNDPRQNLAASCQAYHICNVDADCITKLGWEYMCAPISYHKTYWPDFDINGNEKSNTSITSEGFMQMIQNGVAPSEYNKRCVYRGAGVPCIRSKDKLYNMATSGDKNLRHVTCAPNFYCASIDSQFNDDINRTPELVGDILYGQEANVLGRPLDYVGGSANLLQSIKDNITANLKLYDSSIVSDEVGVCRPGKAIMNAPYSAQVTPDVQKRTDYISQVGSCEPTKSGYERVMSCPYLIEDDDVTVDPATLPESEQPGNYRFIASEFFNVIPDANGKEDSERLMKQNSCGQESLDADGNSPFSLIESPRIPLVTSIQTPKLAINACFRRAGSVCHTDLDCSPNLMQSDAALGYDSSYFGGTSAEKDFWAENLVCGQAAPIPSLTDIASATYSLTKNRCCREIGKDFTMYTETDSSALVNNDVDPSNVRVRSTGTGLKVDRFTVEDPQATGRYSRYISSQPTLGVTNRNLGLNPQVHSETPAVFSAPDLTANESKTPHAFQWKTIHDTGRRTCCGSSFVRKFADGTHNWTKRDRLRIDPTQFQCLNYENMLYDVAETFDYDSDNNGSLDANGNMKSLMYSNTSANFDKETSMMCLSPIDGGCIQHPFKSVSDGFPIFAPKLIESNGVNPATIESKAIMSTVPITENSDGYQYVSRDVPYVPVGVDMTYPASTPGISYDIPTNFIPGLMQQFVYFFMPIYININTLDSNSDGTIETVNFQNIGYNTDHNPANVGANAEVWIHYICETQTTVTETEALSTGGTNIAKLTYQPDTANFKCDNLLSSTAGFSDTDQNPAAPTDTNDLLDEHWCLTTTGVFFANADADDGTNDGVNRGNICPDVNGNANVNPWSYAGITIRYTKINTEDHVYSDGITHPEIQGLKGSEEEGHNPTYYLTKLGRMELLGIPQIYYEPIACNSNHSKLITGLYKDSKNVLSMSISGALDTVTYSEQEGLYPYGAGAKVAPSLGRIYADSTSDTNYYAAGDDESNPDAYVLMQNMINDTHSAIFSSSEFSCCARLGSVVADYNNCCSGYGKQEGTTTKYTCLLPPGADLNVYFNRFVSSEGYVDDLPDALKEIGFVDDDFVPETGEPKLQVKVYDKIAALGQAYCSTGGTRSGSTFGKFNAEPFVGYTRDVGTNEELKRYFSIVDSQDDYDSDAANGTTYFNFGFRWNHHLYCNL